MLNVNDRVELTRDIQLNSRGDKGTVIRKYVPPHSTGCWTITVKFDGNDHLTTFGYPDPILKRIDHAIAL